MSRKKKYPFDSDQLISILTFTALLMILWEIYIFRKTFIHILVPLTLFLGGGFILFCLLRKRIEYYIENEHLFVLQAFHGIILFGGPLMFFFMAFNYYIPINKVETVNLDVVETGRLSRGRRGCGSPYADVNYHGFEKQLIFPCNTDLGNTVRITVAMQKGLFGFPVVEDTKLIHKVESESKGSSEIEEQYLKILGRAEQKYSDGKIEESIDLLERALSLKPSDKIALNRLAEILHEQRKTRKTK